MSFLSSMKQLHLDEGWYSNNPNDRGGETIAGISRVYHPSWSGWEYIDMVKRGIKYNGIESLKKHSIFLGMIDEFYRDFYWNPCHCGQMPDHLADKVFNLSVNRGVNSGGRVLQTALNLLNKNEDVEDISTDGWIGPQTITRVLSFSDKYLERVHQYITAIQVKEYITIADIDSTQREFLHGWLNRSGLK